MATVPGIRYTCRECGFAFDAPQLVALSGERKLYHCQAQRPVGYLNFSESRAVHQLRRLLRLADLQMDEAVFERLVLAVADPSSCGARFQMARTPICPRCLSAHVAASAKPIGTLSVRVEPVMFSAFTCMDPARRFAMLCGVDPHDAAHGLDGIRVPTVKRWKVPEIALPEFTAESEGESDDTMTLKAGVSAYGAPHAPPRKTATNPPPFALHVVERGNTPDATPFFATSDLQQNGGSGWGARVWAWLRGRPPPGEVAFLGAHPAGHDWLRTAVLCAIGLAVCVGLGAGVQWTLGGASTHRGAVPVHPSSPPPSSVSPPRLDHGTQPAGSVATAAPMPAVSTEPPASPVVALQSRPWYPVLAKVAPKLVAGFDALMASPGDAALVMANIEWTVFATLERDSLRAPDGVVQDYLFWHRTTLDALASDPATCHAFLAGTEGRGSLARLPTSVDTGAARLFEALSKAGRPQRAATPDDALRAGFRNALSHEFPDADLDAYADAARRSTLPDEKACAIGQGIARQLDSLPPSLRVRVFRQLPPALW